MAYIDHNTLQSGFENADDHRYIQTVAKKHGVCFSRPGNGICHQVHLERFGKPGKTLIGSDSHTPTGGGIGMLAMGAGGLDVAVAMGGGAYYITMPKMFKVNLTGKLRPFVTRQGRQPGDAAHPLASRAASARSSSGAARASQTLSVPERATITNMGTELGATTSIFPSDEVTRAFLAAAGPRSGLHAPRQRPGRRLRPRHRHRPFHAGAADRLPAQPGQRGKPVGSLKGTKVDQVCIGSCTNSSLLDMLKVAAHAQGQDRSPPRVSLSISPGSKQVLHHAGGLRRADGHPRQRRARAGMRLRPLHRHGLLSQLRRRLPAHLQPQL